MPWERLYRPLEGPIFWHVGYRTCCHLKNWVLNIFRHWNKYLDVVGCAFFFVVALDLDEEFDLNICLFTLVELVLYVIKSMENSALTLTYNL